MSKASSNKQSHSLEELRAQIDKIDSELQSLIADRARLARTVGEVKGLSTTAEFYRPEREAQILRRVVERNEGPLSDEEMVRLFRELMSACLAQEEPLKIAYLGPEGTFTQTAVAKQFGHSVRGLPVPTIQEVFHEVEAGIADFGVAPVENSTEGTVNHTLDMFLTSPLKICGEVEPRIQQHLMGRMSDIAEVRRVRIRFCAGTERAHMPGLSGRHARLYSKRQGKAAETKVRECK
jgi:chorismate mutase/prephenate dehydratase